jgi:NAD+ synthetase
MIPSNQAELIVETSKFVSRNLVGFDLTVNNKIEKIADYLRAAKISNVVVGVSGGIDSAVVIGLLTKVKEIIPLNIHAYTIHFSLYDGIFDTKYVDLMREKFGDNVNFHSVDASSAFDNLIHGMGIDDCSDHVKAQSSYALRYQMLFTYGQVHNAVTIGTTNYDEFKYAGWFGKNSDMVVDLQVITDWHKFQVVEAAKILGIPDAIVIRKPVGDLLDRSTDEENFGCSYNELAYFQEVLLPYRQYKNDFLINKFEKLRALHKKNLHKYQGQTFNPYFIR